MVRAEPAFVEQPNHNQQPQPQFEPEFVDVHAQQPEAIQQHIHIHVAAPQYIQPPPAQVPLYVPQPQQEPVVWCPPPVVYPQEWTTGLFDCMDDPLNAFLTLFCPCVTFGQIAEIVDEGRTSCETAGCIYVVIAAIIAFPCIYSFTYRGKLRGLHRLYESPANDCVTHLCCECCALCQEYRELNNRGSNPSARWMNPNLPQQPRMVPPGYQTMR